MCGRMNVSDYEGIQDFMDELGLPIYANAPEPSYNVAPGAQVVVAFSAENQIESTIMDWGIVPKWAKTDKPFRPLINARAETIWQKPSFKNSIISRRAILTVNGFYEWKREEKTKTAYYISASQDKSLAFGAIYDVSKEGVMQVCIITTESNEAMAEIHHRIPVILNQKDAKLWLLSSESDFLNETMQACNDDIIDIKQVTSYVNNARNAGPKCIATI